MTTRHFRMGTNYNTAYNFVKENYSKVGLRICPSAPTLRAGSRFRISDCKKSKLKSQLEFRNPHSPQLVVAKRNSRFSGAAVSFNIVLLFFWGLTRLPASVSSKDGVSCEAKSIGATGGWCRAVWNAHHLRRHDDS